MGRIIKKTKKTNNDSLVAYDLSNMLENTAATPGSTIKTSIPSQTNTSAGTSNLAIDCYLSELSCYKTAKKLLSFVPILSSIISIWIILM